MSKFLIIFTKDNVTSADTFFCNFVSFSKKTQKNEQVKKIVTRMAHEMAPKNQFALKA